MAEDPFAGVRAKVARAREHAEALNGELDAYMQDGSETDPVDGVLSQVDFDRGEFKLQWVGTTAPPLRWSVMLGEFYYNLRSALDHIARVFVPPPVKSQFPVFTDERDFRERAPAMTKGMRPEVFAVVESLQPFRAWPEHPEHATLWHIHNLCNIDKHNLLHLTDVWITHVFVTWGLPVPAEQVVTCRHIAGRGRVQPDAPIAHFTWDPAVMRALGDDAQVNVQAHILFDIALADGEWLTEDGQSVGGLSVRQATYMALDYIETTLIPGFEKVVL